MCFYLRPPKWPEPLRLLFVFIAIWRLPLSSGFHPCRSRAPLDGHCRNGPSYSERTLRTSSYRPSKPQGDRNGREPHTFSPPTSLFCKKISNQAFFSCYRSELFHFFLSYSSNRGLFWRFKDLDCKGTRTDGKPNLFYVFIRIERYHIPLSQKLILRFTHFHQVQNSFSPVSSIWPWHLGQVCPFHTLILSLPHCKQSLPTSLL